MNAVFKFENTLLPLKVRDTVAVHLEGAGWPISARRRNSHSGHNGIAVIQRTAGHGFRVVGGLGPSDEVVVVVGAEYREQQIRRQEAAEIFLTLSFLRMYIYLRGMN